MSKYIKTFEALFSDVPDPVKNLFDIQTKIVFSGFAVLSFNLKIDWERGDLIEKNVDGGGHDNVYSGGGFDEMGLEWGTSMVYSDGELSEIDLDEIEAGASVEEYYQKSIIKEIEKKGIKGKWEPYKNSSLLITDSSFKEFCDVFEEIADINADTAFIKYSKELIEHDYILRTKFYDADKSEASTYIYYVKKNDYKGGFWTR